MTTKELVQELNRTEDAAQLRKFVDRCRAGIQTSLGRVTFDYADLAQLFQRCDPSIDASRFEELMQIADNA